VLSRIVPEPQGQNSIQKLTDAVFRLEETLDGSLVVV
jgi:hypothetical protein